MGWLEKLFGGRNPEPDQGIYLYLRLDKGGEIVRLRLNRSSDLNPRDEGGYECRKVIAGPRSYARAEAYLIFDLNNRLVEWQIEGGELVSEAEWQAQQHATPPKA